MSLRYIRQNINVVPFFCIFIGVSFLQGCSDTQHELTSSSSTPIQVYQQWHPVALNFSGPETSELDDNNPFLNYLLTVTFSQGDQQYNVRGYYAADGNAAISGTDAGNVWQVKFRPPNTGTWHYHAQLQYGENIAISGNNGQPLELEYAKGQFKVQPSDKVAPDLRGIGRVSVKNGYFYSPSSNQYLLKVGANGPENFLGYYAIDGTYRVVQDVRDGEANVDEKLHLYSDHKKDWQHGDPTFRGGKGKSIFGAINYLASKGMNSVYFLTLNINGDGRDVWPYVDHKDFTRFDVSKLAQWEQVFEHMQQRGIMLHIVTQETENERLLDDGNVGPMRTLYYSELIARFGHHLGLVWNLGEENGYAKWSPPPQDDNQRKAMVDFFAENDPYDHPVVIHTHAEVNTRKPVLDPLLGYKGLDGLSLQAHDRKHAGDVVRTWQKNSEQSGNKWLITMDEIGMWHTGADIDANDPGHVSLRGDVLWGTLLSGAAGVEWYFGAKVPHNDLTSESWRVRDQLWTLTKHARDFFENYLPWWQMQSNLQVVEQEGTYAFAKYQEVYAIYFPHKTQTFNINLTGVKGDYQVHWYNPVEGGSLQTGSAKIIQSGSLVNLGKPPAREDKDWVVLLKRTL
ncbi:DUF5060 domain-containing protein [Thalassotalea sp. G2M2-11]|uniref:DUF5060 domain-containing protein n=1 Tax=Thalassotalea sp. G2M2-11 TaxID=2787627 RepID=UPI0019D0309E|nr:DUF5060 domain-containing protein [Thalassotalea sp. G2M2-11]